MSNQNEIRASLIYVCGINPTTITEIKGVTTTKVKSGVFVPALDTYSFFGTSEKYSVHIPIFYLDVQGKEAFEEMRKVFHEKLDKAFDDYERMWQEAQPKTPIELQDGV